MIEEYIPLDHRVFYLDTRLDDLLPLIIERQIQPVKIQVTVDYDILVLYRLSLLDLLQDLLGLDHQQAIDHRRSRKSIKADNLCGAGLPVPFQIMAAWIIVRSLPGS